MEVIVVSVAFTIAILIAAATLAFSGWVIAKIYQATAILATSQHEAGAKYATAMLSAAEALSCKIDTRVGDRVKLVNALKNGTSISQSADMPSIIEDAPLPPRLKESGIIDDLHEIDREMNRYRPKGSEDFFKRDLGIGVTLDEI